MKNNNDCPEGEHTGDSFYYAFIYLTIFFLVLIVAVQFDPLIQYRYPLIPLVLVLTLLFAVVSILEFRKKKEPAPKAIPPVVLLALAIPFGIILLLLLVSESALLLLLIPTAVVILFLEGR